MAKQLKIVYSDSGLANFYGDHIEINKKLKYDKFLRDYVVKHELKHTKEFDLGYELFDGFKLLNKPKILLKLLHFYITTPSTWSDLFPIQFKNKQIIYDLNLIILYLFLILSLSIFFYIF